jgi:crotonobetainyl-CoA:carnitine CoA-transferase CaiB-like acyl-CoA transferase
VKIPAPLLGQHTEAVFSRLLGLTAETMTQLRAEGII